jgi:glycosyltransferase involved in cell wall biosynthesis
LRVALDYTPAISQVAGVGRYTRSLFDAMLGQAGERIEWTLWYSLEHAADARLPQADSVIGMPLPYRSKWLNLAWHRLGLPIPLERYAGRASVIHGTDFVVPPSSAPSVVTVHDLTYVLTPEFAYPRLRRYLTSAVPRSIDRAARVIAVSEATKRDICDFYEIAPHRVEVIHHAADPVFHEATTTEIMAAQAQFGLRRPYFTTVGTIEPRKDHKTLLKAFEQVHEAYPETSLVIVGRVGWLAEDIVKAINEAASRMRVIHLQHVRDEALPALLGGSTGLVFPTRYEGFGLPLLEAMASGTAVIASDVPALREVAEDAALYAEPGSAETFAARMSELLDSETRAELVDRGRARARQFSWERAASQHLRLYQEVADE